MRKLLKRLKSTYWTIGFIDQGIESVFDGQWLENVKWVKNSNKDDFADPFILDVTDKEIHVLVEDIPRGKQKGVISLLKIDRRNMEVLSRKAIIDILTHLSFPCILRENGRIFIYPESAYSGRLDMYEYHPDTETATFYKTICDDVVWDSCITEKFGEKMLFTAAHNDLILDIYKWDDSKDRFVPWKQVPSNNKEMRMGGQLFEYQGKIYYPAQDSNKGYGSATQIKEIEYSNGEFSLNTVKRITSPHPSLNLGLHTLNEYKGVVVVDVCGYRYPIIGKIVRKMLIIVYNAFKKK